MLFGAMTSFVVSVPCQALTRTVLAVRLDGYCQLGDSTLACYDEKMRWVSPVLDALFVFSLLANYCDAVFVPLAWCKASISFSCWRLVRRLWQPPVTRPVFRCHVRWSRQPSGKR